MSEKIRKLKEDAARLIAKGKLEEACECYEKVVKADNRDLTARQKLAEIYGRLGKTERAVHIYQSVAGSYAADGLLLKAIAVCKIILQLDPTHTETQTILADLSTRRRGGTENVVEMPKAMSEALAGAKKSAATIRGINANQIRGVPANEMRAATRPGDPIDPEANAPHAPPQRSPTEPSHHAAQHRAAQPGVSLGRSAASSVEELSRAAAAMLPDGPPPLVAGMPVRQPPPPPPDDLPIDVDIDDAEPVIVGSVDAPRPTLAGAPILSAAINAALPTFDELLDMVPGESALQQHESAMAAAAADENDEVIIDDSGDDDDADIIDLQPEPAQIDVDKVPPIPLFSDLPRDAFVALTERMDLRVAGIDEPLIVEGEGGSAMFVIIQGRVKVVRDTEAGETVLAELSDGTFFGEMALLSDAPRTASVICTEETMLFVISRDLLADMTTRYPSVGEVMKKFHKNRLITNLLKTSPIFAPFSTNDKKLLIEKFKSRQVDAGSYLITREKPGDGLYVVLSGRCEVLDQQQGQEVNIADLKEGDVFGEMSMLWNKETCASVRATTPCTVLRLPRGEFSEVIMTHPQILETLSTLSEKRLKQNNDQRPAVIVTEFLV